MPGSVGVPVSHADALEGAIRWTLGADFSGYDPYDGLNTRYRWLTGSKLLRLALVYTNKFSPVNLRPLLGIQVHRTPAGVALAARVLIERDPVRFADAARAGLEFVMSRSLVDRYGVHCWNGIDFPIQMVHEYQTPDVPGVVGTTACARLVLATFRHDPREEYASVLRSVRSFVLDRLYAEYEGASFFRYKPTTPPWRCTYNASAIAAGLVAEIDDALGEASGQSMVDRCLRFVISRQHGDGYWQYAIDLRSGAEKHQVDFHQGFVLDQLMAHHRRYPADKIVEGSCRLGLRFYMTRQFTPEGQGLYRWPRRWPANIANQAQGILTFAAAERYDEAYPRFARVIADWTIRNMFDQCGSFHYLRYPMLRYRIPYFRWSQAPMLEALAAIVPAPRRTVMSR